MGWRIGPKIQRKKWRAFRLTILDERGWRCARCGKAGRLDLHHKKPLHEGGAVFEKENVEILCRSCHINEHRVYPPEPVEAWKKAVARFRG